MPSPRSPSGREPKASGGEERPCEDELSDSGALVLVGTPIGNLGDLSPRAVEALRDADVIYAEDTRRTRALLSHCDIPARDRLRTLHRHNEAELSAAVVEQIASGARVAYVSDAGMPGISDPGERIVRACADAGVTVECVPGPSAVVTALVLSALPTQPFTFLGFLERKGRARREQLQSVADAGHTTVLFETANRLAATLADLRDVVGGERPAAVLRELTKLHESAYRGSVDELIAMMESAVIETRGECVVVVGGRSDAEAVVADEATVDARIAELVAAGLRVRDVADAVHVEFGLDRRAAYDRAVAMSKRRPAR
ncbi:MAG TPA: 16S rRNA (cytidine(1402)-2'-O)-methyltransferase [Acidimicrobiia bacterium]